MVRRRECTSQQARTRGIRVRGERQEKNSVKTDYTKLQHHLQQCGDIERAGEYHRCDDLGSIEHRQRKVFAAVVAARAISVAA